MSITKVPHTVLKEIFDLDLSQCVVTVCLASLSEDGEMMSFERLQLTQALTEDFRNVVEKTSKRLKKADGKHELIVQEYAMGSKLESYEIEHIDLSAHETIKSQIDSLSIVPSIAIFTAEDNFVSNLRFYVIILQPKNGQPIYCFRTYSPKKELKRSALFAAIFAKGQFDKVRRPVFLFDHHLDCFSCGDDMFILNKHHFHSIFKFFRMILQTAQETLKTIESRVPIANFEEFKESCEGHLQKLAKLKNISQRSYLKTITITELKSVIQEFNLPIKIAQHKGKEMLFFDPKQPWALLQLLDENYLKSTLTGNKYEVTGKRIIR